jgi:hypothetical protein
MHGRATRIRNGNPPPEPAEPCTWADFEAFLLRARRAIPLVCVAALCAIALAAAVAVFLSR